MRSDLTNTDTLRPGTSPFTSSGAADPLRTPGGATRYRVLVNEPTAGANARRLAGDPTASSALTLNDQQGAVGAKAELYLYPTFNARPSCCLSY